MLNNSCSCNNIFYKNYVHSYSCKHAIKCNECSMRLDLGMIQPHLSLCSFSNNQERNTSIRTELIFNVKKLYENKSVEP